MSFFRFANLNMKRYIKQRFMIRSKNRKIRPRYMDNEYKEEIFKKLRNNDYDKLLEFIDNSEKDKIENMRIHLFSIFDSPHHARRYCRKYNFPFVDDDIVDKLFDKYNSAFPVSLRKILALETLKKIFTYTLDIHMNTHRYKENDIYYEHHIFIGRFKLEHTKRQTYDRSSYKIK